MECEEKLGLKVRSDCIAYDIMSNQLQPQPPTFFCETCDKTFPTAYNLSRHLKSKRHLAKLNGESTRTIHRCEHCGYSTPYKTNLTKHQASQSCKFGRTAKVLTETICAEDDDGSESCYVVDVLDYCEPNDGIPNRRRPKGGWSENFQDNYFVADTTFYRVKTICRKPVWVGEDPGVEWMSAWEFKTNNGKRDVAKLLAFVQKHNLETKLDFKEPTLSVPGRGTIDAKDVM